MKAGAAVLGVFLLVATVAAVHAANPSAVDIGVLINEDGTTDWTVTVSYAENVTQGDFFILARSVTALEVTAGERFIDCETRRGDREIGITVICNGIGADHVVYKFRGHGMVSDFNDLKIFNQRIAITQLVGRIAVTVKLPLGTALVEQSKIAGTGLGRFEPLWGSEGSDGRLIYVTWEQEAPKVGDIMNVSIVYEQAFGNQAALLMVPLVGGAFIFIIYYYRRRSARSIMPILTEQERKVMEILLREKKDLDQRQIVRETDYSKSKVSRIMANLESRGLLERSRRGRTNIVKLKRI